MEFATHVSHYFEREVGPLLNICDLDPEERSRIIRREKEAVTGFNRFSYGEEFFDFRLLADDLLLEVYEAKFGRKPPRRPSFGVLGRADVVGGLYRDPCRIEIPVDELGPGELTFMCPDHFHLVSFLGRGEEKRPFGYQLPEDYRESDYPYFGQLMTCEELLKGFETLKIDKYLEGERMRNGWYRYVEAQIWAEPEAIRRRYDWEEVTPESWTHDGVTYLQNHKEFQAGNAGDGNG